jgi:putative flavoprotein involved in K+ transport
MFTEQAEGFTKEEPFHTIVIGGGQAGLAAGYYLNQRGKDFVILDKNLRTGDAWRERWDSLRLFTPSQFNGLPGKPFPQPDFYYPAKDEVASYLEEYAAQFSLPVRHGIKVEALNRNEKGFHISTNAASFHASHVIVATSPYQLPSIPSFANELYPSIFQMHSSLYRNPSQIPAQSVLIVGAGNSGSEIALELVKSGRRVWLAGRDVGNLPISSPLGKIFNGRLLWWSMRHVMNVNTPLGRKAKANLLHHGVPLGRARRQELLDAGTVFTPRIAGIQSGQAKTEDGRLLPMDGVIWATGFRPDFNWINLPIFDEYDFPRQTRGIVPEAPHLYFLGLPFQTALSSPLLGGVGTDAAYIVKQISTRE